ncbi:MAG: hypothetical protein HY852_25490 [Bradyrhizobium sp.]|uniref:hypothetical protein n=1 Tax=Bradyrhizobium sp. TaxID=376 RepID=UPI0025BF646D|nr:hypothetical protein [Bradyrhizobium sp.]MBI5265162.1 hypothetical protein [Bradyrhizobium sp.]
MSIKSKLAALAVAALTVTASVVSAQAGPKHHHHHRHGHVGWGVGAGLLGAAVIGGAIAASEPSPYYYRQPRCRWAPQYDIYGNYIGRVQTCY